jgi:tetratricopeptide (TPR) repeat protein
VFNHFSEEEIEQLMEAKTLLTEAWDDISDTEIAKFKWYIILNRGVINKVTKQNNQAILDFQKAFDLSQEFLPFKNLLMMYIQVGNLSMASQFLEHSGITRILNEEELFEMQTFKGRLLCLQGKYRDGVALLIAKLDGNNEKKYCETISVIISTHFEFGVTEDAIPWCEKFVHEFPEMIPGYLHSGYLWTRMKESKKALSFYLKAESLLTHITPQNEVYELAQGYMDLEEYEKAIPLFERLANKNKLNSFSRGLIHAYYQYGDLQAAFAIAENLFLQNPDHLYLVEIISNIFMETQQYNKAISIIETFLPSAKNEHVKDTFIFRLAGLYSIKRDSENTRHYALQVKDPGGYSAPN